MLLLAMRSVSVIAHDIRSTHNVGSLLRTCEGLGVSHVYFTGYTPYPFIADDTDRLPHITAKLSAQIHKTALGAETLVPWSHHTDVCALIAQLKTEGYIVAALEQGERSTTLPEYHAPDKLALLLGREVEGIDPELLQACDTLLEIPMDGQKESFNVVQAAAMALYQLRFY
ncbi:MAG TPA: TrmH family RNA methyltransferase [Candidatus Saccharimonadales bacterium]|nr:TrmH family RNA methyltransferase [Candidatus Saccharimonadales bacterium]